MTDDSIPPDRNPIILPKTESKQAGCPKCSEKNWTGRNVQGVISFTCKSCGHRWEGGLPQMPEDPTRPYPRTSYRPAVEYFAKRNNKGEIVGHEEIIHKPDLSQPFRKGAPIPDDEGDGY